MEQPDGQGRLTAAPTEQTDGPRLEEFMSHRIVAIVPEATAMVALRLMATTGTRHLPVLAGSDCVGIVTEVDLLHALGEVGGDLRPVGTLARPAATLRPSARRAEAARRMTATGTDAVLVADDARLVGIVTATDLLRSLASPARGGIR
jgi:CBS domain-containing protein